MATMDADPIINGVSASADDFPMAGGLLMDGLINLGGFGEQPLHSFVCSSTLIAPDVVLTAAHCIDDYAFTFGFGTVDSPRSALVSPKRSDRGGMVQIQAHHGQTMPL